MIDQFGRTIDYMRLSITDRCNLRCQYCMPRGIQLARHSDILSYEEMLRICAAAVSLGIVNFKVTGGEPLIRKDCVDFIARLKGLPGVEQVTLTTNGLLLHENLDALCAAGIDGINISIDTVCDADYRKLTGYPNEAVSLIRESLIECVRRNLRIKVNTVLLTQTFDGLPHVAAMAAELPVDVRFIELMPIGEGGGMQGVPMQAARSRLQKSWPDLHPVEERRGNGPAHYYAAAGLKGRIGFIDAVSHSFCGACNRVRLTATGSLKPCLCYDEELNVRAMLRDGCSDEALQRAVRNCIWQKPHSHCFVRPESVTEQKAMSQIGG